MAETPVAVLGNKVDIPGAMGADELWAGPSSPRPLRASRCAVRTLNAAG